MQFYADYKDGKQFIECIECVVTLAVHDSIPDQAMSDIINKHAFMSHGMRTYASIHITGTPTPERPHLRTVTLAYTAPKKEEPMASVEEPEEEEVETEDEDKDEEEEEEEE